MKNNKYYPESLKKLPIWALWRLEPDEKGRDTKVPYSPHYNGRASSVNPKTWGTFYQADKKFESRPGYYNGLALVISKEYKLIFIDIDHCIDEDGTFSETAIDIVEAFEGQFVELSQSGTGIHIITMGIIPKSFKNSRNGVEMYADKRFCSLTGNAIEEGTPTEKQSAIDYVFNRYKTPDKIQKAVRTGNKALPKDDRWIIDHASQRGKFGDLYAGNWESAGYNSQSEADLSLCVILAFWTNCDINQMDRIFRSSGLYRAKWERQDYRESTLKNAVSRCGETLTEYTERKEKEGGERFGKALSEKWDR